MQEIQYQTLTLVLDESGKGYRVQACEKDAIHVTIPSKINGVPVLAVNDYAFENCTKLRSVDFPPYSIEADVQDELFFEIGEYAFSGCTALISVDLPSGMQTLSRGAFYGCTGLQNVRYPMGMYVSSYAFAGCTALKSVSPVVRFGEGAFSHCKSLEQFPVSEVATEIPEDAFEHCEALTDIVIPASVRRIEPLTFRGCKALKNVRFISTEGWVEGNVYTQQRHSIDVTNPVKNANNLSRMDFDDGITGWIKE